VTVSNTLKVVELWPFPQLFNILYLLSNFDSLIISILLQLESYSFNYLKNLGFHSFINADN
jgi:hypothetical protein